jgi:hypothetical protein
MPPPEKEQKFFVTARKNHLKSKREIREHPRVRERSLGPVELS